MDALLHTPLTRLLGIRHPIVLAPMGGVAGGRLAAAVTEAGGFGFIGAGYGDPDALRREIAAAGSARVGIGFITFALDTKPDSLRIALETQPPALQLSFGDPSPYVAAIRDAGALFVVQVQTVDEARRAADLGADLIMAQGQDSGGHGRPGRGTIGLVPAVVDAVGDVPVIAAGGIADGRGLAAALMLGAAGAALGTRLFATTEALSDPTAQDLLVRSTGDQTVRTPSFDDIRGPAWPQPYDGRALRNSLSDEWSADLSPAERQALLEKFRNARPDDYSIRPLWAGEGLDLIHSSQPAAAVIDEIVTHAAALLARGATIG
jgi:nitronate monooxygenase